MTFWIMKQVLRYNVPKKISIHQNLVFCLHILFYIFRFLKKLMSNLGSCCTKFMEGGQLNMLHKGSSIKKLQQKLSHFFLSGYAGVGKSYVTKTKFNTLIKLFNFHSSSPQKVKDKGSTNWRFF